MKFSCEKGLLQSACAIASRATASKSPIPALEGLLIEAKADVKITSGETDVCRSRSCVTQRGA